MSLNEGKVLGLYMNQLFLISPNSCCKMEIITWFSQEGKNIKGPFLKTKTNKKTPSQFTKTPFLNLHST